MKGLYKVSTVAGTWDLARQFAKELKPGDVVCLEGDLGAGKTTFTQAVAAELKVSGIVTSPTFCIVGEHRSTTNDDIFLVHMDLYRLESEDDVLAIGWEDYLAQGAILMVEWPERAGFLIPQNAKRIVFRHGAAEEERTIEFIVAK